MRANDIYQQLQAAEAALADAIRLLDLAATEIWKEVVAVPDLMDLYAEAISAAQAARAAQAHTHLAGRVRDFDAQAWSDDEDDAEELPADDDGAAAS